MSARYRCPPAPPCALLPRGHGPHGDPPLAARHGRVLPAGAGRPLPPLLRLPGRPLRLLHAERAGGRRARDAPRLRARRRRGPAGAAGRVRPGRRQGRGGGEAGPRGQRPQRQGEGEDAGGGRGAADERRPPLQPQDVLPAEGRLPRRADKL